MELLFVLIVCMTSMCGSHSVSFGQYGLRYSDVLTESPEVRKGILEEGAAKTHWIKTEVTQLKQRSHNEGISGQEIGKTSGSGPRGQQGLGGLSPRQPRAGPEGGSYWSQVFQISVSLGLGKLSLAMARLLSLPHCWHSRMPLQDGWV